MTRAVIGVLGGNGGVGASSFAALTAAALAEAGGGAVLVDADPAGGGADVLLGIEGGVGVRWSGLRVGGGRLDPDLLLERLPTWRGAHVLACDRPALAPSAARQVVEALAARTGVVVDLPRAASALRDALIDACALIVVVVARRVREVAAAAAVVRSLPPDGPPLALVIREGAVPVDEVETVVGVRVVAEVAGEGSPVTPEADPSVLDAAGGVVDGLLEALSGGVFGRTAQWQRMSPVGQGLAAGGGGPGDDGDAAEPWGDDEAESLRPTTLLAG